jgi:hypothetical protein
LFGAEEILAPLRLDRSIETFLRREPLGCSEELEHRGVDAVVTEPRTGSLWQNNKTRDHYVVLLVSTCTDNDPVWYGRRTVVYKAVSKTPEVFDRKIEEFLSKFTEVRRPTHEPVASAEELLPEDWPPDALGPDGEGEE